jgi:hypothetical protein
MKPTFCPENLLEKFTKLKNSWLFLYNTVIKRT